MDCWFITLKMLATERGNKIFCFAIKITFREIKMLEEAYGKLAMKKKVYYTSNTRFCDGSVSVNDNPCCGQQ
jgi:hypothetical protein